MGSVNSQNLFARPIISSLDVISEIYSVGVIIPTDSLLGASSRTFSLGFFVFDDHATIPKVD
jgi:hypothetical protein